MKLFYPLLVISLFFSTFLEAQEKAPNFIVTDIHGQTHELYDYLCQGKYVVIDFFGTWCGPCQGIAPDVAQGYKDFGCNYEDVVFISIDTGSDTQACFDFEEEFTPNTQGLPMVSGYDGGGDATHEAYGITGVPTIVTINPNDTSYTETHLGFYNVLNAAGIETKEVCTIPMEVDLNIIPASSSNVYNAQLGVSILGGVSPFSIKWMSQNGSLLSNEATIDGVAPGVYQVSVIDASSNPVEFVANVEVGYEGQILIEDDFESYEPFTDIVSQTNAWQTMCDVDNVAQVTQAFSQSGENSMFVFNGPSSDVYKSLGDRIYGAYEVKFHMYIPSEGSAYYRLMHKMSCDVEEDDDKSCEGEVSSGAISAMDFYAESDGEASINIGMENAHSFSVPIGEWFELKHLIDLTNGVASLSISGEEVYVWPFIYSSIAIDDGLMQLAGVQFKSMTPENQVRSFYIDNFNMTYSAGQDEVAGCTDDDALNYNISATIDDGTCEENISCVPVGIPFFEDFEEDEFLTNCWKNLDRDMDGHKWEHMNFAEGDYGHNSLRAVGSSSYINNIGSLDPDNLLRLPKLHLEENTFMSYYVKAEDNQYLDHYSILVYEEHVDSIINVGSTIYDTIMVLEKAVQGTNYVQEIVDLTSFSGKDVYIAFRHHNDEGNYWMYLDDIYVFTNSMIVAVQEHEIQNTLNLYPNPTRQSCYITFSVAEQQDVTIDFINIQGQLITSRVLNASGSEIEYFDLSTLSSGIYLVKVSSGNDYAYKRLIIN